MAAGPAEAVGRATSAQLQPAQLRGELPTMRTASPQSFHSRPDLHLRPIATSPGSALQEGRLGPPHSPYHSRSSPSHASEQLAPGSPAASLMGVEALSPAYRWLPLPALPDDSPHQQLPCTVSTAACAQLHLLAPPAVCSKNLTATALHADGHGAAGEGLCGYDPACPQFLSHVHAWLSYNKSC